MKNTKTKGTVLKPETTEALRIVIADNRGLTFVGRCTIGGKGEWITIKGARCLIYWGTKYTGTGTGHIAQLVDGPTSDTRLGAQQTVRIPRRGIVAVYDCNESGWEGK